MNNNNIIDFNYQVGLCQNRLPSLSAFAGRNKIRKNILLRYLRDFGYLDDYHRPTECAEDWFITRMENRYAKKLQLSITPIGEKKIKQFCRILSERGHVKIYKK